MSRSFRKTPKFTWCGGRRASEAIDKKTWHRAYRAAVKNAIRRGDELMPHHYEVSDPWTMRKDGPHRWWPNATKADMRK